MLNGKKTYLVAALWALATYFYSNGSLDEHTYQLIQGVLFPAGLAALRAGVK
jgi:hypothetical protein